MDLIPGLQYRLFLLRHYFKSRSKFDIHSPFVYNLYSSVLIDKSGFEEYKELDRVFREKNKKRCDKTSRLLFRIARKFGRYCLVLGGEPEETMNAALNLGCPGCRTTRLDDFHQIMQQIEPDSVLIFMEIYRSHETRKIWTEAKKHPRVTVSIDLFHLGLLFFREELSKEEFLLRF